MNTDTRPSGPAISARIPGPLRVRLETITQVLGVSRSSYMRDAVARAVAEDLANLRREREARS